MPPKFQIDSRTQFTLENIFGDPDLSKELSDPVKNNFQISQGYNDFNISTDTQTYRNKEKINKISERRIKRKSDTFLNESLELQTQTENDLQNDGTKDTFIPTSNEESQPPNDQKDSSTLRKLNLYDLLKKDRSKKLTKINKHDKFYPEQKQKIFF